MNTDAVESRIRFLREWRNLWMCCRREDMVRDV